MDYIIYLSQSKVDMLYSQVPATLAKKLAAEIGGNLGVFSFKVRTADVSLDTYEKSKIVEKYISKEYTFGTLEEPKEWIKAELEMKNVATKFSPEMFALVGKHNADYFLLGGSAHNVIGNRSASLITSSLSYLPHFVECMRRGLRDWDQDINARRLWIDDAPRSPRLFTYGGSTDEIALAIREIYEMSGQAVLMRVGFIARRLAVESLKWVEGSSYLYTPLYVTQTG
jgi:hypothetical protein